MNLDASKNVLLKVPGSSSTELMIVTDVGQCEQLLNVYALCSEACLFWKAIGKQELNGN